MGDVKVESFLRFLFVLGFMSVQQLSITDAEIEMLRNGITTVGKTFRVVCKVTNERFEGWYDRNDNIVTKIPDEDELPEDKFYKEVQGNSYTLVIQDVVVADGGNYTCRGNKTIKVFTLYVEFFVTEFPLDQDLFVGRSQVINCSAEGYPKPTFKWYKNRRLVKFADPRFTLLSNGSLLINPVHELDTAEYICRITQLGTRTEEGTNLREESKNIQVTVYGPPRINLEKSSSSELYSYIDNPTPVTITCHWWGYPVPTLSIKKNNKELPREDVKIDGPKLEATVKTDSEDDFGSYLCHASNTFGDAAYDLSVKKAGKPSPPINITFATTCDHLTVAWNEPESDGGLPLTHYEIELRDAIELFDEKVFVGVQTKRFTFTSKDGVNPRTNYTVALQAFNKLNNGTKGERVVLSAYCPPSGPFNITNTVTLLNETSFTLKWTRPPQDGGDPELKYDIEYSKANSEGKFVHWNSRKSITGQEYNVTGLERGSRYQFKVFVFNIAGRKREPASKEFNVTSGDDEGPGPTSGLGGLEVTTPDLVYDMSINCTSFYMQVNFALKSSYLNVETFRFDNKSCGSYAANSTHVSLRTPLNACGTTSRQTEDSVTYFNKVVAETKDKAKGYVVEFPFSCTYNRRETIGTPSFQPRKKVTVFEEGYGNFSFEMGLYRSSEYASPYDVSEYPVTINPFGQLYCQAKLDSSDPDLVLRTDTCVATPSMDPSHSVQFTFIEDGCSVDNGTRYTFTMSDTQRFQLVPFRWIRNYTLVYLHCNVIVCHKDQPSRCSRGCQSSSRRKRSTGNEEEHRVTLGPVMLRETQRYESHIVYKDPHLRTPAASSLPLWIIILIIFATVIVLGLMLFAGVHLFYLIASKSQDGGLNAVQRHSEEVELFRSENV